MTDTPTNPADAEILRLATASDEPEAEPKADDTLELGSEEAPKVEETDEQKDDAEKDEKGRSRPWSKRVDILTARLREAERRAEEAEARANGVQPKQPASVEEVQAKKPNPDDFEFGVADPDYTDALTDWKLDLRDARANDAAKADREADQANQAQRQIVGKLEEGMATIEKTGAEKYDDFEQVIEQAVEARGGEPLPPLVSIGIAVSPAGADIAYNLAKDEALSSKLERLAQTNPQAGALAFGELEGQYLPADHDDSDLNLADPLDLIRMNGRMKARLAGKAGQTPTERKTTKAPAAPERARGAGGQFEVSDDTEDFAAFERKIMGKRG